MAYRRPAIEVIEEFQQAAAALALPSLPACVVGPAFQVASEVNVGIYSEDDLAGTSFSYVGLATGALVDLTDAPEEDFEANAHASVAVKLENAYLIKVPDYPSGSRITGKLVTPNKFQDSLTGAFASFDPDAAAAPTFYVEILGGVGVDAADLGRKLVIGKTDDNELIVAAEWKSSLPLLNAEYRVLEFREDEVIEEADFATAGISKDADSVDIDPGLQVPSDSLPVVEATVLLSWRALRPDLAGALTAFTDLDSLEAVFGIGTVVPANVGAFAVNLALQNTTTEVNFVGLNEDFYDSEEQAYQSALEFLEGKDVYAIALMSQNTAVHQLGKNHVEGMSVSTVGRERVCIINRKLAETEVLVPASGIGTVISDGTDNGLSGTDNKTFKDPTNGSFVTDDVGVGHFLEIVDYTAVEGVQRSVDPNERDFFGLSPSRIRLGNGAFVSTDVGRLVVVRGATTSGNNIAHTIATVVDGEHVTVSIAPAAAEALPSTARTWIADLQRSITHDAADNVVAATKTWSFANGAFTEDDIGRILFMAGTAAAGDKGAFIIASVVSGTQITTLESPGADETFGGGVTQKIYSINREPARDATPDSVDGTSREWTILNGVFTSEDIGRKLRVAGATAAGNNADHIIESIVSSTKVKTDNTTTPVTEEFDGLTNVMTTLDVVSVTPNLVEDDFIKNTRHEIASITSESQLVLATDPSAGFGGTLEDVEYRISKDLSLNEQAELLAGYASSLGSRRVVSVWPDTFAVSVNGLATKVPGYFASAVVSGLTAGMPSQAGFTNLAVTGFVGRENSDDRFSDTQLDTIAGGGNMIFIQTVPGAALSIRHQLTTDVSTIFFQEFSVTKNVDLIARFFRVLYKPFIGVYNITEGLLDLLKTRGEGGIAFLKAQRAPRVGAPLRKGQLARIEESADQPDSVEIDIDIGVPLPLNNLRLKLLV